MLMVKFTTGLDVYSKEQAWIRGAKKKVMQIQLCPRLPGGGKKETTRRKQKKRRLDISEKVKKRMMLMNLV